MVMTRGGSFYKPKPDQHGRPARVGTMPGVKKHKNQKEKNNTPTRKEDAAATSNMVFLTAATENLPDTPIKKPLTK